MTSALADEAMMASSAAGSVENRASSETATPRSWGMRAASSSWDISSVIWRKLTGEAATHLEPGRPVAQQCADDQLRVLMSGGQGHADGEHGRVGRLLPGGDEDLVGGRLSPAPPGWPWRCPGGRTWPGR